MGETDITGGVPLEMVLLEILRNSLEDTRARVSFLIELQAETCNCIKKQTLVQVFSCEFCEISKNIFFKEHLRAIVSGMYYLI